MESTVAEAPPENPVPVPITQAEPQNQNELIPATEIAPKAGIGEKIRGAADSVFGKYNILRRGKGRPRKDGSPKISDLVSTQDGGTIPASEIQSTVATAPVVDSAVAALFRRTLVSGVKGLLGIAKDITRIFANAADIDEKFTEKAMRKAEPDPEAMQDFSEAFDLVLKKYNVQPKHAEEIALGITAGRLLLPYAILIAEFRGEIARKRSNQKAVE